MGNEFLYRQPVVIRFGWGKIAELGDVLKEQGADRCLVACDRFLRDRVEALQQEIPEIVAIFSEVEENPQLSGVEGAVKLAPAGDVLRLRHRLSEFLYRHFRFFL